MVAYSPNLASIETAFCPRWRVLSARESRLVCCWWAFNFEIFYSTWWCHYWDLEDRHFGPHQRKWLIISFSSSIFDWLLYFTIFCRTDGIHNSNLPVGKCLVLSAESHYRLGLPHSVCSRVNTCRLSDILLPRKECWLDGSSLVCPNRCSI